MTIDWRCALCVFFAVATTVAAARDVVHVRLQDRLDRPRDGYCLDIVGTGSNLRLDLPLFAHNCKSGPTPDSSVRVSREGWLRFPGPGVCVTAFGVNNTVLPGTAVLLRPCGHQSAFFDASRLQRFDWQSNGQLRLRGFDVCLSVGEDSAETFSPADRWRVLLLARCTEVPLRLSAWERAPLR
ncbi:MAG: hypothetical protein AAGA11_07940 [Pseudomonadota bacterium]